MNGTWIWVTSVDEEFAWENDIYVIGADEVEISDNGRLDGGAEYTGWIQITDLNSVEH